MLSNTYLTDKLLVGFSISLRADRLLQEGQEDRDNDTGLEALSETDEEHFENFNQPDLT